MTANRHKTYKLPSTTVRKNRRSSATYSKNAPNLARIKEANLPLHFFAQLFSAIPGYCKGFFDLVKEINLNVMVRLHFVYQENLAFYRLFTAELETIHDIIHIVNYSKSKFLNSQLLRKLCENLKLNTNI